MTRRQGLQVWLETLQEIRAESTSGKVAILQDLQMEWNVGLDAVDDVLMHGGFGAADRSCAIGGVHDYLRNQWIIMNRDAVTIIQGGFDPNTEAARRKVSAAHSIA